MSTLTLVALEGTFAVSQLSAADPIPRWALDSTFSTITRTGDELSIVCREELVPPNVTCEKGWRCLQTAGPLDFDLVGVLASLVGPLAKEGIPVFVISTFSTDYLLVKTGNLGRTMETLRSAGHTVESES
jgi:hypothetical protein